MLTRHFTDAVGPLLTSGESYSDISVARLIAAVDVSRSTFYSYFVDKGDLLRAMGEDVTLDLAEAGAHWFDLEGPTDRDQLREALRHLFDTYRRHQMLLRAITETAAYDAGIRALHLALVDRAATGLREHIEREQGAGVTAPELDATRTAQWMVWMLERGLYQLVAPADDDEADNLLDSVTDVLWRILYEGRA